MEQGGGGGGDAEITSPLLFPIFQPLPTLFLASFHEFLKIHQCEVRRRERDVRMKQAGMGGWRGRDVFLRPPSSVSASQLLICVWVSLGLSLPDSHLSKLPHGPLETPELQPGQSPKNPSREDICI